MKQPFHAMTKPVGPACNLACEYCFYLDKAGLLYPGESGQARMSPHLLEQYVKDYIAAQPPHTPEVTFAWQGGEPTLAGLEFFETVVVLQKKHSRPGMTLRNAFQTNAVLVDENWARFFHREGFLIGVSIDGPPELHDRFRYDRGGHGSLEKALTGIGHLKAAKVDFNTLTVVNSLNAAEPQSVYRFLKSIGSTFLQFIPLVEADSKAVVSSRSVTGGQWGTFLNGVFHQWRKHDVGSVFVQLFDVVLALHMGYPASLCVHAPTCGRAVAVEKNGDVFSCDHFVDPAFRLGNLSTQSLSVMVDSPFQKAFGDAKSRDLPRECQICGFLPLCHGACPKDRLLPATGGKLNWLCEGYKAFYAETTPYFQAMARALNQRLPASEYRRVL